MPLSHLTEITAEVLFRAVRERDERMLSALLRHLTPWLAAQARRAGAKPSEVDEVVQDAWIAALTAAEEFRADSALRPWLAAVVRHRVISLRRSQRRRARLHAASRHAARAPVADPLDLVRGREALHAVRRAVDAQASPYREVLRLHLFEGLASGEIAQRLGLGRVRVRVRLSRALRRLRRALPDMLALMLLAALTRRGASQAPVWFGAAAVAAIGCGIYVHRLDADPPAVAPVDVVAAVAPAADVALSEVPEPSPRELPRALATAPDAVTVRVLDARGIGLPGVGVTLVPDAGVDPLLGERRAHTDASGGATFARIVDTKLRVLCDRGVRATLDTSTAREAVLLVGDGIDLRGRVVDAAGRAVAGARIWLAGPERQRRDGVEVATVDADGCFALRNVALGSVLAARAAGYAGTSMRQVVPGADAVLVLEQLGGTVAIEVLDAQGAPCADAAIVLGHSEIDTLPQDESLALIPPYTARSDERGRWAALGVEPGYLPLMVRAPGFAPFCATVAITAGVRTPVRVQLQNGSGLSGRVVGADGQGVAGARVACRSDATFSAVDARTDADGGFRFAALPRGEVGLLVWAPNCNVEERVLTLGDQPALVDVHVEQRRRRPGVIETARGEPLAGWELSLPVPTARSVEDKFVEAIADAQGRFVLDLEPRADWNRLLMRPPGSFLWAEVGTHREDQADGSFVIRVPVAMLAAGRLRGRVRAADGIALANAPLCLYPGGGRLVVGTTDADGRFDFAALPVGDYQLSVEAPHAGQPAVDLPRVQLDEGDDEQLDVTAPATGRFAFELRFAAGGRPHAPIVTIESRGDRRHRAQLFGAVGEQVLAPGEYAMSTMGDDFVWKTIAFAVKVGERTAVALVVKPAAKRQFSLRNLPVTDHGGELSGRFFDLVRGTTLYSFRLPLDKAFPLPLTSYLPIGSIGCEATTASGQRLRAEFTVTDLQPSFTAGELPFVSVPESR